MSLESARERRRTRGRRLTDRQTAVLELVASGLGNKEIAHELGISEQAVKEHVSNLLRLLAAPNRAALGDAAATLRVVGTTEVAPEWLGLLFLHAPLHVALLEGDAHRFIAVNDAYRRAAGPRELIGRTFREVFPDLNEAGVVRLIDEAYRTGEPQSAPAVPAHWYRESTDHTSLGYFSTMVQPMRHADGSVGGVAFFAIDVTDEVEARNAARDISDERQAILDQLPSGVVTVDAEGIVMGINATGREILGVGDEIVGRTAWETLTFVGDGDAPLDAERRPLRRALNGARVDASDYRAKVAATGKPVDLRISAAPLFDARGKVRGAVAVFTLLTRP